MDIISNKIRRWIWAGFNLHSWIDSNSAEECACVLDVWVVGSDQLHESVSVVPGG